MTGRSISRGLLAGAVLLAAFAAFAAGCGVRPSGVIPGAPAPSGPIEGDAFYLVFNGELTPVVRAAGERSPSGALALLAAGPTAEERAQGFTSEVPPDAEPIVLTSRASDMTVRLGTDVTQLSTMAVDQIVCTAVNATAQDQPTRRLEVTLVGRGRTRAPQTCPLFH
ncbi:GerMN domain-containing protein [Saccharopolyspora sp. 5N708]|uniref:GerMN domain-containing protein n=1 Tax=Saccharopolyspora sp. 5N708 TaxID=3457424 RepID=UPI003FD39530